LARRIGHHAAAGGLDLLPDDTPHVLGRDGHLRMCVAEISEHIDDAPL